MERIRRQIHHLLFLCTIVAVHVSLSSAAVHTIHGKAPDHGLGYFSAESECSGFGVDSECQMESEMSERENNRRRILATARQYIGYGALRRNSVPCSRRGSSYYNCRAGAPANPYSRSCSQITRCRR